MKTTRNLIIASTPLPCQVFLKIDQSRSLFFDSKIWLQFAHEATNFREEEKEGIVEIFFDVKESGLHPVLLPR